MTDMLEFIWEMGRSSNAINSAKGIEFSKQHIRILFYGEDDWYDGNGREILKIFLRIFRPFLIIHTIHINLELSTMYKIHKNRHFSSNVKS